MPGAPRFQLRLDHGALPPPGGPTKTRLAVRAIVGDRTKLLLVRSRAGDWKFPGGGVEPRETPEDALARELIEETGYGVEGPVVFWGRVVERREGRDVPGSLFEMESRYYRVGVGPGRQSPHLDDYERALGLEAHWVDAQTAWAENHGLVGQPAPPWLERETQVLALLLEGGWLDPA